MNLVELGLILWLVAIGFVVAAAFWPHGPVGHALVSPIVGAATYVLAALALFTIGVFSTLGALMLASIAAVAVLAIGVVRAGTLVVRDRGIAAAYAVAGTVAIYLIAVFGTLGRLSPDSIDYLTIAGGLERFGVIPELTPDQILKRQFVTPALQAPGVLTGRGYFLSVITLLGASGFGLMLWLGVRALALQAVDMRRVAVVAGLVGAFVLSTNRVLFHLFYVNGHGTFAALLVLIVGLLWYATLTEEWSTAVLAGIAAAAIVLLRAEGVIVVAFFLLPVLVSTRTPTWVRWMLVIPAGVTALVWNGLALPQVLPAGTIDITSAPVISIGVAASLILLVAATQMQVLDRLMVWVPFAAMALLVLYAGARSVRGTTSLFDTLSATGANLASEGLWVSFWWIAPLAVMAVAVSARVPFENRFLWGLAAYPVLLLAFAYLRGSAYRVGPGDSANRMLMHIVFVIGLYLIVAVGQVAARVDDGQWSVRSLYEGVRNSLIVG